MKYYTITDFCRSEYEFLLTCKIILKASVNIGFAGQQKLWLHQNLKKNIIYFFIYQILTISFILSQRIYLILVIVHRARSTQLPIRSQERDRRCHLHGVICSGGLSGNRTDDHTILGNVLSSCTLENTKAVIKNGQSRETGQPLPESPYISDCSQKS